MKWKSRKFLFTAFFLCIYLATVIVFLVKESPTILDYLKNITPIVAIIILGYHSANIYQKKLHQ